MNNLISLIEDGRVLNIRLLNRYKIKIEYIDYLTQFMTSKDFLLPLSYKDKNQILNTIEKYKTTDFHI